jgi:hypothetical protein
MDSHKLKLSEFKYRVGKLRKEMREAEVDCINDMCACGNNSHTLDNFLKWPVLRNL